MFNVHRHLPFVKEQIELQEKLAKRFEAQPWRHELHTRSGSHFKELADDLVKIQDILNEMSKQAESIGNIYKRMSLTLEDIEGLPDELIKELSISDSDKLEFAIVSVINQSGGILSLDKILVGLYKSTGEIHKRNNITSRLYRMRNKGLIFNVPNKAGFYSSQPISEQEVRRIFGQEDTETVDNA